MAHKFYLVWSGREIGVFADWATTQRSVDKSARAHFKSFPTRAEAGILRNARPEWCEIPSWASIGSRQLRKYSAQKAQPATSQHTGLRTRCHA